ncbi:MAG: hypothetical protein H6Q99_3929, partial [Proteobacteria bacterium]|nr:hypothetical protein [Pseudomonadota bacterium]
MGRPAALAVTVNKHKESDAMAKATTIKIRLV